MQSGQPQPRVLADFAWIALHFKLLEPGQVVVWADTLIKESDVPPEWLLDLSLMDISDVHAPRVALRAIPGTPDLQNSVSLLNALILRKWRQGHLTMGKVRRIGWQLQHLCQREFDGLEIA